MAEQAKIRAAWITAEIEKTKALETLNKRGFMGGPSIAEAADKGFASQAAEANVLRAAIDAANASQDEAMGKLKLLNQALEELKKVGDDAADSVDDVASSAGKMAGASANAAKATKALAKEMKALDQRHEAANKLMAESVDMLDELISAQEEYEDSLQSILDAADPVGAAFVTMEREIALLTKAYDAGDISLAMYADALEYVASKYGAVVNGAQQAAEETSLLATAIDEGVRIMERAFTDM